MEVVPDVLIPIYRKADREEIVGLLAGRLRDRFSAAKTTGRTPSDAWLFEKDYG